MQNNSIVSDNNKNSTHKSHGKTGFNIRQSKEKIQSKNCEYDTYNNCRYVGIFHLEIPL